MTLKEFKDLTKDMPEDADVIFSIYYPYGTDDFSLDHASYISEINTIRLC